MGERRTSSVLALLGILVASAASAVPAAHCTDNVYVLTRAGVFAPQPVGVPVTVTPEIAGCLVGDVDGDGHEADTRYVTPGSTMARVRYIADLGSSVQEMSATLQGLGAAASFTLRRERLVSGYVVYDGPWLAIDPNARGTLVATVYAPTGVERDVYRTIL